MLTQSDIAVLVLRAKAYHLQLVSELTDKERQGDVQYGAWKKPISLWYGIEALNFSLYISDYVSDDTVSVYNKLYKCIGANALDLITTDPTAQLPGGNVVVIGGGSSGASEDNVQSAIIPFNTDTVTLDNYQSLYKPLYGNNAVISIWTLKDGGIGYTEDTGTTPTKIFQDNDPTKDLLSVTWTYPQVTQGYIQILGFNKTGSQQAGVLPPITNLSAILLSNTTLNTLYPFAKWGQLILLPNVPVKYEKLDDSPTGLWDAQEYTLNT